VFDVVPAQAAEDMARLTVTLLEQGLMEEAEGAPHGEENNER
jgi:hypothetical protein